MVQLSSLNALKCIDINEDGYIDIVSGGNEFGFLPQFERLDASKGDILLNNGKGSFSWIAPGKSGLKIDGEVRDIQLIMINNEKSVLFLQNDGYPLLYQVKNTGKAVKKN